ncbi:MAG: pyridoxal-phosphate dependent enzyme [Candidatus Sericytochromatia bacterium]
MTETYFPLFEFYPELKKIPKLNLGVFPTPIKRLANLEKELNISSKIYIKRDDLSNQNIYGGNKVRKLEFTLAKVLNKKSKRIITGGGIGSNMTIAVSAFAREYNIKVNSVFFPQPKNDYVNKNFDKNIKLGSEIYCSKGYLGLCFKILSTMFFYTLKEQKIPYLVIPGDSNPLSNLGYVNCIFELKKQIEENILEEPDYIFVSSGSCGTTAGLLAGIKLANLKSKIIAVRVAEPIVANKKNIIKMAYKTINFIEKNINEFKTSYGVSTPQEEGSGGSAPVPPETPEQSSEVFSNKNKKLQLKIAENDIEVLESYLGKGYGHEIPDLYETIELLSKTEEIKLDPTYTAKGFLGLLDFVKKLESKTVLFIHTYSYI